MATSLEVVRRFIESHGHPCTIDGDRLIAETECVFPGGRTVIEYETFTLASRISEIRDWLGY